MSFWRRIWGVFNGDLEVNWSETVKGGVEASDKIFALAEAVNKKENKEFLKSISPYLQETASLLDVLNSPLGEVVKSTVPFLGIATSILSFVVEQTKEELSLEGSIFLVVQGAYLESFKEFFDGHPEYKSKLRNDKVSKELEKKIKAFGERFTLDENSATNTLVAFRNSEFAAAANELLKGRLMESGFTEKEAQIITLRISSDTYGYLKQAFIEIKDKVPKLTSIYGQRWQDEIERYHSIDDYLKEIETLPEELIFQQEVTFKQLYVPLKVQPVKNGKIDKNAPQLNIESWTTDILLDEEKKKQVLFIQGRPGGGKSVFCRMFSDAVRKELYPIYIPILICLRNLDKDRLDESVDEMLSKAIARDFVTSDSGWLTDNNTRYVFFLDGFDELVLERGKSNSLRDFLEKVNKFQIRCGENAERGHRVIITGRPFALYGIERFIPDEFIWVSLALMDEEIQDQWFSQWQSLVGKEEVTEFRDFLNNENCPQQVRELAQEPLLLYLLASMHRDSNGDENRNNIYGASLNIEMLQSADADLVKAIIYQAVINWVLRKQRPQRLTEELAQLEIEDLEIVLMEAGVCVTQTGQEYAKISMIEERLIKQGETAAKELIEVARKSNEKDPLKNALAAFYLKAATGQDNSVEFFHKSFGEFLMARRLTESFWKWTEKGRRGRGYVIKEDDVNKEIYDLLGYGHLTVEVLDYVMPLLKQGENISTSLDVDDDEENQYSPTDWVTLYERLYGFYLDWSDGLFINAYNEILPLNKARELKDYHIMVGQQAVDIYTGLNVMLLLFAINSYAQGQESLKEKIYFHPCGDHSNEEEFNETRLLKIMGYCDCLEIGTFNHKLGQFLCNADLSYADLSYANFTHANFIQVNLSYADLFYTKFFEANLSYADLNNANLKIATLNLADLSNADLNDAALSCADLSNADLSNAVLTCADLSEADLSYADLSDANLNYANLNYANLRNADLEDITWNEYTNWEGVQGLETAKNVPEALREQLQL